MDNSIVMYRRTHCFTNTHNIKRENNYLRKENQSLIDNQKKLILLII